jgi:hypothetical protein
MYVKANPSGFAARLGVVAINPDGRKGSCNEKYPILSPYPSYQNSESCAALPRSRLGRGQRVSEFEKRNRYSENMTKIRDTQPIKLLLPFPRHDTLNLFREMISGLEYLLE